jgi:hypothetical protein
MHAIDRYLVWLLASAIATVAVAWIAFGLQQEGVAPAVLFPLAVGGVLGSVLVAIRRLSHVPGARVAALAAFAWGLLAVVGQDYIGHRHRLRVLDDEMAAQGPIGALASAELDQWHPRFVEHLCGLARREPIWWTLDLLLTAGTAGLIAAWGTRRFGPVESSEA